MSEPSPLCVVKEASRRTHTFFDAKEIDADGHLGDVRAPRRHGLRQASIRGFHSFRTTFITIALVAGVPEELVRKVTGHKAVEIVRESYFKPGDEELKREFAAKMPALFTLRSEPPADESPVMLCAAVRAELANMNDSNWASVRDRVLARIDRILHHDRRAVA